MIYVKHVGVLDVQGDITEHARILEEAARKLHLDAKVVLVNTPKDVEKLSALILPGGESTTLGKLLRAYAIDDAIRKIALQGVPVMGTCAGLIILSRDAGAQAVKTRQPLLSLLDVTVDRNYFGRQKESFETELDIPLIGKEPFHGVFIRSPIVESVGPGVEVLCKFESKIVMVKQKNILGLAFHPELSGDCRIHEYFLRMMK